MNRNSKENGFYSFLGNFCTLQAERPLRPPPTVTRCGVCAKPSKSGNSSVARICTPPASKPLIFAPVGFITALGNFCIPRDDYASSLSQHASSKARRKSWMQKASFPLKTPLFISLLSFMYSTEIELLITVVADSKSESGGT